MIFVLSFTINSETILIWHSFLSFYAASNTKGAILATDFELQKVAHFFICIAIFN